MIKGKTEPRIWTPPLRDLTRETTLGFDVIDFANDVLHFRLYPWEEWLFIHALELIDDEDGTRHFRFRTVLVLISRQNGKSVMSMILALFFLYVLGVALVIGTSLSLDMAEEVWDGVVDMVDDNEELKEEVAHVDRTNGKKQLKLTNARRYKIKAATRKGGRGLSGDLVLLDELREHQTWDAWAAVSKTTLARPDALIWCMSNAGDVTSVVLRHFRLLAHKSLGDPDGICGELGGLEPDPDDDIDIPQVDSIGIFEWSATPGCRLTDLDELAQANPSLGYGLLTERALLAAAASDPEVVFRTECLCQWIEAAVDPPFPAGSWDAGTDPKSEIAADSPLYFGIDVSVDRKRTAIAVCGRRPDGDWHIEVVALRAGTLWALKWLIKRAAEHPGTQVAYQGRGAPVSSMADDFAEIPGLMPVECVGTDLPAWCGRLWDAVAACQPDTESDAVKVHHRPAPSLDIGAAVAVTHPLGDGAWAFDRNKSPEDISPLFACAMAFGLATRTDKAKTKKYRSAYADDHELITI